TTSSTSPATEPRQRGSRAASSLTIMHSDTRCRRAAPAGAAAGPPRRWTETSRAPSSREPAPPAPRPNSPGEGPPPTPAGAAHPPRPPPPAEAGRPLHELAPAAVLLPPPGREVGQAGQLGRPGPDPLRPWQAGRHRADQADLRPTVQGGLDQAVEP